MATSGSVGFTMNAGEIVEAAFRTLNVVTSGETLKAAQLNDGMQALNLMTKEWQTLGIALWATQEVMLVPEKGVAVYDLASSHCTGNLRQAVLSADCDVGDGVALVGYTDGMAVGDNFGIMKDSGLIFWTTINAVTAGVSIDFAGTIDGLASAGKAVYAYTNKINAPHDLIDGYIRRDSTDIDLDVISRSEYNDIASKSVTGVPTTLFFDKGLFGKSVSLWPVPDGTESVLYLTVKRTLEDFVSVENSADFPVEWLNALKYGLAANLAHEVAGVAPMKIQMLENKAKEHLSQLAGWDQEDESVFVQPVFIIN